VTPFPPAGVKTLAEEEIFTSPIMKSFFIHLRRLDWLIITSVFLLVGVGLCSIYSSSLGRGGDLNFRKQLVFLGVGFFLMLIISFFDWRNWQENPYLILILYFLSLISLAGLFFFAPEIRGVKSWYRFNGFSLDPVEFAKIILVVLLAKYFSMRHIEMYRIHHLFLSGFYVFLPAVLIFLQPNMGSVLVLLSLWLGILFVSGIKIKHFLILCLIGAAVFAWGWHSFLKDYQKSRVINFIFPQQEPLGAGWSQMQAKIAIGAGGLFGQGLGRGSQTQLRFLPEPHTDFIFAAIAEEMGLIGVVGLFTLFAMLFWRIVKISLKAQTNFPRLLALGFGLHLAIELFINLGMNLGILPIIGLPLPFVSYGGSSLITGFISLGILQSIKANP